MVNWKRTLRTATSERFLAFKDGKEAAAIDLHYLANGAVAGTVILLQGTALGEAEVPALLSAFDDDFLPDVDLAQGNLTFTVVMGHVLANYEAAEKE